MQDTRGCSISQKPLAMTIQLIGGMGKDIQPRQQTDYILSSIEGKSTHYSLKFRWLLISVQMGPDPSRYSQSIHPCGGFYGISYDEP